MLAELVEGRLQYFVKSHDGPDALLYGSRKRTPQMDAEFYFVPNGYRVSLEANGDRLLFTREETCVAGASASHVHSLGMGHDEARLTVVQDDTLAVYVRPAIASWRVYHFSDTSTSAGIRQKRSVRDNLKLKPDAENLASFLRRLREQHGEHYTRIVQSIRLVAPFFGDFVYRKEAEEYIDLEWFETNDPDTPFGPRQLSDGTLRFICLATLLLQPRFLQPDTILIDEPELGLHPYALGVLAAMLKQAAEETQLIVSTQSVDLVNALEPEDVVVVNRNDRESTFTRLEREELSDWLHDYALGELWKMNILGGRPAR